MVFGDQWSNRKYPDGCRSCGQTEKRHVGLGLCQNCYRDADIKELARTNTLGESDDMVSKEDVEIEFDTSDNNDEVLTVDEEDIFVSSERRPGTITSSVSDQEDAPSSVENKVKGFFKKKKQEPKQSAPFQRNTGEKSPKGITRRVSTSETIEDLWSAMGGIAIRTGRYAPLGRYLQWQAPAAGEMLDGAVSGTIIDKRLLQPAVKTRGRLDMVVAVFGPPGIIMAITQNPDRAPQLIPILKSAIRSSLPTLLPAMKKAQAREEKVNKAVAELFGEDFPPGVDPVDMVIEQMFAGWYVPPTEVPTEETESDNAETFT